MPKRSPPPIRVEGDVAYITLTRGFEAIVDVSDLDLVKDFRWTSHIQTKGHVYARRNVTERGMTIFMHRLIMAADPSVYVDHKDGDGLNNRRSNLRFATPSENNMNMIVSRRSRIGIKGVRQERSGNFGAVIHHDGSRYFLGTFATQEEASAAYFGAARVLFGEYARR